MLKRFLMIAAMFVSVSALSGCAILCPTCAQEEQAAPVVAAEVIPMDTTGIYFDFDKYTIKEESRSVLADKATYLKANPNTRVRIEGNCDARGTQEYNLALGERRAQAAYEYLVALGVNPAQLEVISYGKERPAVEGKTAEAYAKNRRDDFTVLAK